MRPPPPSLTLAPDLPELGDDRRRALDACLLALTGRHAGVPVTGVGPGAGTLPVVSREEHGERLEMLLVMRWLDEGARDDGEVALPVAAAAGELGLAADREGLLAVMAALGELEDRRLIEVAWPGGAGAGEARVTLSEGLRRDARRLFGRA